MASRTEVLALYRRILQLHRAKLPQDMRKLGDAYVRKEWRDHKTAASSYVPLFLEAWTQYADDLQRAKDVKQVGRDLNPKVVSEMTDEQRMMLAKLEREARGARR